MTPEQVKALRAGDGVMGLHSGNRYIVRSFRDDGWPIAQDKYGTEFCLMWMKIRRETFREFLTRPSGMGETSWWAVALPNIGLGLIALKYGDLWYWPAGTAVAYTALLVYMGWRNYTHKTV
jgi:hypothetical protein